MTVQGGRDWFDCVTLVLAVLGLAWSALGVLILGIYTLVTAMQAFLTRKALAETRKSNKNTEESNRIAERSLELGKRAWLVIAFKPVEHHNNWVGYKFELTNVGEIPATNVEFWYSFDSWESAVEIPDEIQPKNRRTLEKGIVVGAGMTHPSVPPADSYSYLGAIGKGVLVTCYCMVTYRDYFDRPRETVACWQYRPEITIADQREWIHAPKHNTLK